MVRVEFDKAEIAKLDADGDISLITAEIFTGSLSLIEATLKANSYLTAKDKKDILNKYIEILKSIQF